MLITPTDVPETEIQRVFNDGNYMQRALDGEFACCILRETNPANPRPDDQDHPEGTRSVTVAYLDDRGRRIFVAHLFLYPDPTGGEPLIGGSGHEDPKWLYVEQEGAVYRSIGRADSPTRGKDIAE